MLPGHKGPRAPLARQDSPGHRERKGRKDRPALRVQLDLREPLGLKVQKDHKAPSGHKAARGSAGKLGRLARREPLVHKGHKGPQALKVRSDPRESAGLQVRRALLVRPGLQALQVLLEHKVRLVKRAMWGFKALPVLRVPLLQQRWSLRLCASLLVPKQSPARRTRRWSPFSAVWVQLMAQNAPPASTQLGCAQKTSHACPDIHVLGRGGSGLCAVPRARRIWLGEYPSA